MKSRWPCPCWNARRALGVSRLGATCLRAEPIPRFWPNVFRKIACTQPSLSHGNAKSWAAHSRSAANEGAEQASWWAETRHLGRLLGSASGRTPGNRSCHRLPRADGGLEERCGEVTNEALCVASFNLFSPRLEPGSGCTPLSPFPPWTITKQHRLPDRDVAFATTRQHQGINTGFSNTLYVIAREPGQARPGQSGPRRRSFLLSRPGGGSHLR